MVTSDSKCSDIELETVLKSENKPCHVISGSIADLVAEYSKKSQKLPVYFFKFKEEINSLIRHYKNNHSKNSREYLIASRLEKIVFAIDSLEEGLNFNLCTHYLSNYQKNYQPLYNRLPKKPLKSVRH